MTNHPLYDIQNPPAGFDEQKKTYHKHALTEAMRMQGPFAVNTSEGVLTCDDGYIARDARGYFYPIAKEEFELIYEEAHHLNE